MKITFKKRKSPHHHHLQSTITIYKPPDLKNYQQQSKINRKETKITTVKLKITTSKNKNHHIISDHDFPNHLQINILNRYHRRHTVTTIKPPPTLKSIIRIAGNCKNLDHRKNSQWWREKIEIRDVFMVLVVCVLRSRRRGRWRQRNPSHRDVWETVEKMG